MNLLLTSGLLAFLVFVLPWHWYCPFYKVALLNGAFCCVAFPELKELIGLYSEKITAASGETGLGLDSPGVPWSGDLFGNMAVCS